MGVGREGENSEDMKRYVNRWNTNRNDRSKVKSSLNRQSPSKNKEPCTEEDRLT